MIIIKFFLFIHKQLSGDEDFYRRFEDVIKNDILNSDLTKLKSIILKLLLIGCKNSKVQTNLVNNLLNLIIENFGDRDEMVGKRFSADSSTFQMLLDLESHDEIISRFMRGSSQHAKMK